jgi:hypothetical protein
LTSSAKLLGTTVIGVDALNRLMAGDNAALPSDEFLGAVTSGSPSWARTSIRHTVKSVLTNDNGEAKTK